jgi:hypothetical protein
MTIRRVKFAAEPHKPAATNFSAAETSITAAVAEINLGEFD